MNTFKKSEEEKRRIVESFLELRKEGMEAYSACQKAGAARDSIYKWALQLGYGDLRQINKGRPAKKLGRLIPDETAEIPAKPAPKKPELLSIPLKTKPENKAIGVAVAGDETFLANFAKQLLGE